MATGEGATTLEEQLRKVRRIAEHDEPILRNLLITQGYHDLARGLRAVLGGESANWAAFATWASNSAGKQIREETPAELAELLRREARLDHRLRELYVRLGPFARLAPRLDAFDLARAVVHEVALQVAEGNRSVFADVAPMFAGLTARFAAPDARTPQALAEFLATLPRGAAEVEGQDALQRAFQSYFAASLLERESERAELVLLGNVLIALHEQTRLHDTFAAALDAPFSARVHEQFGAANVPKLLRPAVRWLIRRFVGVFARHLLNDWRRLATRLLMKLTAPNGEELSLGSDLPPERFDPLLTQLTNTDLVAVLGRFDRDLSTTRGSAAVDWSRLEDRMRFIAELFRVSQRDASWFDSPFTELQRVELEAGRVPSGKL